MDTFEIKDDEINVEEIMEKIRENIRRRKEAGIYPADPVPAAAPQDPGSNPEIARDLAYLSGNWDVRNNSYFISSHRPVAGKVLVKGRELVHGEVRRYVDPVIWKQTEFNRATGRALEDVTRQVSGIEALRQQVREDTAGQIQATIGEVRSRLKERLREQNSEIRNGISEAEEQIRAEVTELVAQVKAEIAPEVEEQLRAGITAAVARAKAEIVGEVEEQIRAEVTELAAQVKAEIAGEVEEQLRAGITAAVTPVRTELAGEVRDQVQAAILAMDTDIENRAWLAKVLEGRAHRVAPREVEPPTSPTAGTGLNYFAFEDHFRGSREDIKERQRAFVHYFEGCSNVLDIGCGRGEFLELMREQGVGARGVDLDETMVEFSRSRGLAVELNDAVSYLEQLEDSSLDGVFIDQVVEHLEPAYLVRLLELCCRKMKSGYYLVAETVNPLSFASFANFYIDMTHVRPVHPETLKFLFSAADFREMRTIFSSPVQEGIKLRKLILPGAMDDERRSFIESYNFNIDLLNGILYGDQDYAVVGKK